MTHASGDGKRPITIGEFHQGPNYRTIRDYGQDNCLLILTLEGRGQVRSQAGGSMDVITGDILLYQPGIYQHYGTAPGAEAWVLAWSHFVPEGPWVYWKSWYTAWAGLHALRVDGVTMAKARASLAAAHQRGFKDDDLQWAFMYTCLQRAFLRIEEASRKQSDAVPDGRVDKALTRIHRDLREDLSVEALARACGLSLSRFAHLFKEVTGEPPQRYVEARRMRQAASLLRFANLSIKEVADAIGFEDPLYFSARFKKFHGTSPRAWRSAM